MNSLTLSAGKTYFTFPGTSPVDISTYDNFIASVFEKRQNHGSWASYVPGNFFNSVTQFTPGKYYLIYAKEEFTIQY
jgi:hypothetical protein